MKQSHWQVVVAALRDVSDGDSALAAERQLRASASHEDVPRLIDLLTDSSFFVREAAAWALCDLERADALPQLFAAYERGFAEGHDNDGFSAALLELVHAKRAEVVVQLEEFVKSDNLQLRDNASWLLEFCRDAHDA